MKLIQALLIAAGAAMTQQALAISDCPKAPREKWLSVLDMQKKIVNEYGFSIKKFHKSGDCYEIYGWGPNKAKTKIVDIEVYFDPVTGAIVELNYE